MLHSVAAVSASPLPVLVFLQQSNSPGVAAGRLRVEQDTSYWLRSPQPICRFPIDSRHGGQGIKPVLFPGLLTGAPFQRLLAQGNSRLGFLSHCWIHCTGLQKVRQY